MMADDLLEKFGGDTGEEYRAVILSCVTVFLLVDWYYVGSSPTFRRFLRLWWIAGSYK